MKFQGLGKRVVVVASVIAGLSIASWQASAGRVPINFYGNLGTGTPEIEGTAIEDLTSAPNFPDSPAAVSGGQLGLPFLTEALQWPEPFEEGDFANNYGTMAQGYISVPTSGEWKFFVRSDDASQLELNSSGPDPSGAELVAEEPECCNDFVDDGTRSSEAITLESGNQYYFRMLHKEGGGGDWWQVGWMGPNMDEPTVIDSRFVQEFVDESDVVEIVTPPQDTTVPEANPSARFEVAVRATPPVDYQWLRNGEPIDGATSPFLDFEASLENDGDTFSVEVTNGAGSQATSAQATLTVDPDTVAPTVTQVSPRGDPNGVNIFFSEAVAEDTALNAENYSIDGGDVEIESTEFYEGPTRVRLNTSGSGFEEDSTHTVEIRDVTDRSSAANRIDPNPTTVEFTFGGFVVTPPDHAWLMSEGEGTTVNPFLGSRQGDLLGGAEFSDDSPFPGQSGSVEVDGTDGVIDFGDLVFNGATEFTMSMWIRAEETGIDRGFFEFVDSGGSDSWGIGYDSEGATAGGQNVMKVGITTTESPTTDEGPDQQETMENVQTTDWQHVAWTWEDGEGFNLWIDGEPDDPTSPMERTDGALDQMEFFRLGDGRKDFWLGKIGETAIWDGTALNEEEIQRLAQNSIAAGGQTGPVEITAQPQSVTVDEHGSAALTVEVGGAPPYFFQWLQDGEPIEGATGRILELTSVSSLEDGSEFSVEVSNEFSSTMSDSATLSVNPDTDPPSLDIGGQGVKNEDQVILSFSEPLDSDTAQDTANYQISGEDGDLAVNEAILSEDGTEVTLNTGPQTVGAQYTVTVNNVQDRAGEPNTIEADSEAIFFALGGFVQDDNGMVVFEAENFDEMVGNFWQRDTERGNPSGGASMVVPNGGGGDEDGAQLLYNITFNESGRHIVWYRASGEDGSDDSGWLHIDGDRPPGRSDGNEAAMSGFSGTDDFEWNSDPMEGGSPADFSLDSAGEHTFGLALREDGSFFDKFIITTDPDFEPEDEGPPETLEGAPPLPTVEITSVSDGEIVQADEDLTLTAEASHSTEIRVVEFFQDGEKIGEATSAPFEIVITDLQPGRYDFTARAENIIDQANTTEPVEILAEGLPEDVDLTITENPQDRDVAVNESATFSVGFDGNRYPAFQWQRDGVDIEDANEASLTTGLVSMEDDGASYRVLLSVSDGLLVSESATLSVREDDVAPTLAGRARGNPSLDQAVLAFSEPMDDGPAGNPANYSIENDAGAALNVQGAQVMAGQSRVLLTTDAQTVGDRYTVTVNGLTDLAGNELAADSQAVFFGVGALRQSADGFVVVEAENATDSVPQGEHEWVLEAERPGFSGAGYMVARPNQGDNISDPEDFLEQSPRLDLEVEFEQSGTYYLWVRALGATGSDDSLHVGFDGEARESSIRITGGTGDQFGWWNSRQSPSEGTPLIEVSSTGTHTLNVWMREDGTIVDKILLAPSSAFEPTGMGPSESPREGAPPAPTVSLTSPESGQGFSVGADVTISAEASAPESEVARVNFFANGLKIGEATSSPFEITWPGVPTGVHTLSAEVVNDLSDSGQSAPLEIVAGEVLRGFPEGFVVNIFEENDGTRFIEHEDYNYEEGQWIEGANGGPTGEQYPGGEYAGLKGVNGIDFNDDGGGGAAADELNPYRWDEADAEDVPGPATADFNDPESKRDRGSFTVENTWKVGWTAEGEWYNYTRDFPEEQTTYEVYAHISSGGSDPMATLQRVTSDPTQTDQTTEDLGQFSGPASGDWGTAIFYKMHEVGSPDSAETVTLSGMNTLRWLRGAGDQDLNYMAFVPVEPEGPIGPELSISLAEGTITVEWEGDSDLETAPSIVGPWEASDQSSPATFSIDDSQAMFFRTVE